MSIEEIDKWLDDEYGCSYTRLEELHDFVVEQDLKHREEAEAEIERLNNIINELEKTLNERKNKTNREPITERTKIRINYNLDYVLNKLKELKGSDSNEKN